MNTEECVVLNIESREELLSCYLPFIQGGGFFLPNTHNYKMGDSFKVEIKLLDDENSHFCVGKVVLVNPNEISKSPYGTVGIQLIGDNGKLVKKQTETYLAGALYSKAK